MPKFFYTNSHGPDEVAFSTALTKLVALAQATGTAAIYLMNKANLDGTVIENVLGAPVSKTLKTKGVAQVQGITLKLLISGDSDVAFSSGPILAVYVHERALSPLIASKMDLVFVPWMEEELAKVLGTGNWTQINVP